MSSVDCVVELEHREHDVIVVGGRPAGAGLAARLGAAGLRVLVLDRSRFPSRPAVSASFVLPHTLAMLDELGVDESVYAAQTPPLRQIVLEFSTHFRTHFRFFEPIAGRRHFYGIDRARLDHALWMNLQRWPRVTAVEAAAVVELLEEGGRVVGVRARVPGHEGLVNLRGRCVVGAGGRNDLVARKVRAPIIHQRRDVDTAIYYAHWEGVAPYDVEASDPVAQIHASGDGFSFVLIPTADARTIVIVQTPSEIHAAQEGSPIEVYEGSLRGYPLVWRRLRSARRVSRISGFKRMGNLFRQAHGPGWALVGDAFHQKDSFDAQGIYDALLGGRLLGEALVAWNAGERSWDDALDGYAQAAHEQLRPIFDVTMSRVKRELYGTPPPLLVKTVMRWILTHERYGRRLSAVLTRQHDPHKLFVPSVLLPAMVGGAWRRLWTRLGARPDPSEPLELDP